MTPEITEVTCTRGIVMDYFQETPVIWVISLGVIVWLVTLMQKLPY